MLKFGLFFMLQLSFSQCWEKLSYGKPRGNWTWVGLHIWNKTQVQFLFLPDFAIIMKSKLNFGFKLNFYWTWVHAWTLIFLHIKTRKKNQIQIWCSYLELVGFLLKCVEISWVLRAFSLFLHKEINKKAFFRNEHLYRSMDLNPTSLVCETLKKGKQFFF